MTIFGRLLAFLGGTIIAIPAEIMWIGVVMVGLFTFMIIKEGSGRVRSGVYLRFSSALVSCFAIWWRVRSVVDDLRLRSYDIRD